VRDTIGQIGWSDHFDGAGLVDFLAGMKPGDLVASLENVLHVVADDDGAKAFGKGAAEEAQEIFARADIEAFVETAALEIADNMWPDELVDPWPLCPQHRDHPLQVRVHLGTAVWVCLQEPTTAVRVGDLANA